jgi:SAM-dependent methyltransferase
MTKAGDEAPRDPGTTPPATDSGAAKGAAPPRETKPYVRGPASGEQPVRRHVTSEMWSRPTVTVEPSAELAAAESAPGAVARPTVPIAEPAGLAASTPTQPATTSTVDLHAPGRMTTINQRNYERQGLLSEYLTNTLTPAEVMIFVKYRDQIANKRLMDIGCGAGRITRYLSEWSPNVVGIDFSRQMVDYCKSHFTHLQFFLCDVRELTPFADGSVDVAVFTFNGIDTLSHESRLVALAGVRRILSPGGLFIFSTHNRRFRGAHDGPTLGFSLNPGTLLRNVVSYGLSTVNHARMKRLERSEAEYAIVNDDAHDFTMLHYYIDRETQGRQLASVGFQLLEVYGQRGEVLGPGSDDSQSSELYYVARK